jgi:hypothetical protein
VAEPSLIRDYLVALSAELPAPVVAELADGLEQTHRYYLGRGLDPGAAARAAVTEFGEPQVVVAAFIDASPARRTARRLLAIGPVAGACWGTALVINWAWAWPVPAGVRVLLGAALITVIGLLAAAAFGRRYRPAVRAAAAGCAGVIMLDAAVAITVTLAVPAVIWPVIVAAAASAVRISFATRSLRSVLTGC